MAKLRRLRAKELIKTLARISFEVIRVKVSHHFLKHAPGRTTVVPVQSGEIIGPGLLSKILRDCEMTKEDRVSSLKRPAP